MRLSSRLIGWPQPTGEDPLPGFDLLALSESALAPPVLEEMGDPVASVDVEELAIEHIPDLASELFLLPPGDLSQARELTCHMTLLRIPH